MICLAVGFVKLIMAKLALPKVLIELMEFTFFNKKLVYPGNDCFKNDINSYHDDHLVKPG